MSLHGPVESNGSALASRFGWPCGGSTR